MKTNESPPPSFQQFKATRKFHADLSKVEGLADCALEGQQGYTYLDCCYIEIVSDKWEDAAARDRGAFHLLIERSTWLSDDLAELERRLYDWAAGECFDAVPADPHRFTLSDEVLNDALNAAVLVVQRHIGQTDGGIAGQFFSGDGREGFDEVMQAYADVERLYAADGE